MTYVETGNVTICGTEIDAREVADWLARIANGTDHKLVFCDDGTVVVEAGERRAERSDLNDDADRLECLVNAVFDMLGPSDLDAERLDVLAEHVRSLKPVDWAIETLVSLACRTVIESVGGVLRVVVEVEIGGCTMCRASLEQPNRGTLNTEFRARWLASALVALAGWYEASWVDALLDSVDASTVGTAESGSWPFPKAASMA